MIECARYIQDLATVRESNEEFGFTKNELSLLCYPEDEDLKLEDVVDKIIKYR